MAKGRYTWIVYAVIASLTSADLHALHLHPYEEQCRYLMPCQVPDHANELSMF